MNLDVLPDLVTPIRSWARRQPDAPAITHAGTTIKRRELDRRSDAVAADLLRRGVSPGDRVGIMGTASPQWCFTALAVLKIGAVIVPMTERLSPSEVSAILARVEAVLAVSDADHAGIITTAREAPSDCPWGRVTFDGLAADVATGDAPAAPIHNGARGDQLAIIAFTSGSTGLPKGSMLTHAVVMHALFEWVLQEPALRRCRALEVTSLAYLGGLLNSFLGPLVFGGSVVLLPRWNSSTALSLIASERSRASPARRSSTSRWPPTRRSRRARSRPSPSRSRAAAPCPSRCLSVGRRAASASGRAMASPRVARS